MPKNVLEVLPELIAEVLGIIVLFGAALMFAYRRHGGVQAAESGRRAEPQGRGEVVAPDGFIDTFAAIIEEAGGGLPFILKVIIAVFLASWFLYLVLFFRPL